jgi:hypothetical protein
MAGGTQSTGEINSYKTFVGNPERTEYLETVSAEGDYITVNLTE